VSESRESAIRSGHGPSWDFTAVLLDTTFLPVSKSRALEIQSPVDLVHADLVGTDAWFGVAEDLFDALDGGAAVHALEDTTGEFGPDFACSRHGAGDGDEFADLGGAERTDRACYGEVVEAEVEGFGGGRGRGNDSHIVFRLVLFDKLMQRTNQKGQESLSC
jgi:hypothetical protein